MANRIIIFILGICLFNNALVAQEEVNLTEIDAKTYQHYLSKNIDSVQFYYTLARKNNIDFYYLRMRVGILEYEQQKYFKAIPHFEKALDFYPADTVAQEYLYYSYLFVNRNRDAIMLSKNFSETMKEKLKIQYGLFSDINTEFTYAISDFDGKADVKVNKKQSIVYDEVEGMRNEMLGNVSFSTTLPVRLNAVIGIAPVFISNRKYAHDYNRKEIISDFRTHQYQFFIKPELLLNKGWQVNTGFSYIFVEQQYPSILFDVNKNKYITKSYSIPYHQKIGFVGVQKFFQNIKIYSGASVAELYQRWHVQPDVQLVFFPLQNLNLYWGAAVSYHWTDSAEILIYQALAGFKPLKKLWLEGNYFYSENNLNNYITCQSLAVNDFSGVLTDKLNASFIYLFNSRLTFRMQFAYQQLQTPQWIYTSPTQFYAKFLSYQLYSFKGGITWRF